MSPIPVSIRSDVLAQTRRLNPRQAGALDHLLAHGKLTLGELESIFPDVNRRTLQRDLKAMLDKSCFGRWPRDRPTPIATMYLGSCDKL
jgi:hypothetical protein